MRDTDASQPKRIDVRPRWFGHFDGDGVSGLYPVECRIGIIVRIGRCFATDGAGQCDLQSKRIVNLFATITPDIVLARDAADRARIDVSCNGDGTVVGTAFANNLLLLGRASLSEIS